MTSIRVHFLPSGLFWTNGNTNSLIDVQLGKAHRSKRLMWLILDYGQISAMLCSAAVALTPRRQDVGCKVVWSGVDEKLEKYQEAPTRSSGGFAGEFVRNTAWTGV